MKRKLQYLYLLPGIIWSIGITILLLLPGSTYKKPPRFLNFPHADKLVHFGFYAGAVFLLCWGVSKKKNYFLSTTFQQIALAAILHGIAIEFLQKYATNNRSFDVWDIIADTAGALFALLIANLFWKNKKTLI